MNVQEIASFVVGNDALLSRERWTLIVLAAHADDEGWLRVPYGDLCQAVGVSGPTLRRSIKELETAGLVEDFGTKGSARIRRLTVGTV
ncbi:MAG TPA: helix-turn-helix domain-containing protein [Solirubrobacterales bacterium]|nr:helix-turn-helix domain-containing protein [Solirubrobacterales bacterium]